MILSSGGYGREFVNGCEELNHWEYGLSVVRVMVCGCFVCFFVFCIKNLNLFFP